MSTREHYPGQLWLTDQLTELTLLEEDAFEAYVVHVDERGITYEAEGRRFFSPWSAVLTISIEA